MKLSPEQQALFSDWLQKKMEQHSCTLCQANHWKIGELMPERASSDVGDFDAATSRGLVQLVCKNCGHVLLFDVQYITGWNQHDISQSAVM